MNPTEFHARIRSLFHELADLEEREALDRLERSDAAPEVVAEVRALLSLAAADSPPSPLDDTRLGGWNDRLLQGADRNDADEEIGEEIDGYMIRRVLGVGGMGTVYLAEQRGEIERTVALKLIKLGMDSRMIVTRFEAERQALALMNHEGIARVYDCGTSERGRPYFVMEYVEGTPIDRFCLDHDASLEMRLDLIQQVCEAVHHAHQKGVVHRDLKPGNVLVSFEGQRPRAKVIDFGLAKAMGRQLVEATLFTEVGQVIGTPEFMAPEQADPNNTDIDTRTDVYAIGVMMFQLLVGELPFTADEVRRELLQADGDARRRRDPPKPSTRLASQHGSNSSLRRALRTDLDWIVLKAMDPDRTRRYDSAAALAEDIQRFANHEPLVAGPPSASYRVQKLARRYRAQLAVAAIVVLALVVGSAVALDQWLRASRTVGEFEQLAGVVNHEVAIDEERALFPAWPEQLEPLRGWIEKRWQPLRDIRPRLRSTIASLRAQALPLSPEERNRDITDHPRYEELELLRLELDAMRYANAIRTGEAEFEPTELSDRLLKASKGRLYQLAWTRVAPTEPDRSVWGEEAAGLAFARALLPAVGEGRERISMCTALKVFAFASLANGQDEDAVTAAERAVETAVGAEQHVQSHRDELARIRAIAADPAAALARLVESERELSAEIETRRTWRFADSEKSAQFLHDTLSDLAARIDTLESDELQFVRRRIRWAESVKELTFRNSAARCTWDEVRKTLATSTRYAHAQIELLDSNVYGLVPLGTNPATGYLEFYHARSAWDGEMDPMKIPIPRHDEDGRIEVGDDTGIVFVLLPGGRYVMGSQAQDPSQPNYDPLAKPEEMPHDVRVGPFFIARHELTKAQWRRLVAGKAVAREPSGLKPGTVSAYGAITWADPIEQVDWSDCVTLASWHRLTLPTEVQWEYACRAGSSTRNPWPKERIGEFANIADRNAGSRTSRERHPGNDGFARHAPVGVLKPNAFGLHDMIGNVFEWCLDEKNPYRRPIREGDGLRLGVTTNNHASRRILRGGYYLSDENQGRAARRDTEVAGMRSHAVGVRLARSLRPNFLPNTTPVRSVKPR